MSIELKPREWLLALWANGTFTVEAADASCWQAIAPPSGIRVVAALPVEAEIKRLHEGREEAEAAWNTQYDELARLRAALAAAEAKLALADKWARFGSSAFYEFWGEGEPGDIDAGEAQDMAIKHGLLRRLTDAECNEPDAHCEFCGWQAGDPASECQCLMPTCGDYRPDAARRAHDSECESEFDSQVHAQTPCGCAARRAAEVK